MELDIDLVTRTVGELELSRRILTMQVERQPEQLEHVKACETCQSEGWARCATGRALLNPGT